MARKKQECGYRQGPPLQFRPGVEIAALIASFAAASGLEPNEGCKALVALAVTEMDRRFFGLLRQLAEAMGGTNAFPRACAHVHTSLQAARRATGASMQFDPERAVFILQTVRDFLAGRGLRVAERDVWFLAEAEHSKVQAQEATEQTGKRKPRRKVSENIAGPIARAQAPHAQEGQSGTEEPEEENPEAQQPTRRKEQPHAS